MIKVTINADVDGAVGDGTYLFLELSVPSLDDVFDECRFATVHVDENDPVSSVRKITSTARNLAAELNGDVEVDSDVFDLISDFDDADECIELLEEVSDVLI